MPRATMDPEREAAAFATLFTTLPPPRTARGAPFDRGWWRRVGEAGFWRIPVPVDLGGYGFSWACFGRVLFDLGLRLPDLGVLLSLVAHAGLVRMVLLFGDRAQQAEAIPRLMDGTCIGATAITEPGGGSDVRAIRTQAVPVPEGYRLSGQKRHITNAPVADTLLVVARVGDGDPRPGEMGLFLFDRQGREGAFQGPEAMIGHRSSPTGGFNLTDMVLGPSSLLGLRPHPLEALFRALALDRALYALGCAAVMEAALESALEHTTRREAFGKHLIDHQYVQKHLTDIIISKEVARNMGFEALDKLDADTGDPVMACSIAKLVGSEGLITSTLACMRTHGHAGYLENAVSRMTLDALGSWFAAGTNDIQRLSILKHHLNLRKGKHV